MKTLHTTPKQIEILLNLYRFRFLNRSHIQKILKHKDYSLINIWLKDLTEKKVIGRIYTNKLKENTVPAIYYLDSKAIRILKDNEHVYTTVLSKAYREKTRSVKLREHCLLLADIYLKFLETTIKSDSQLEFYSRSQLAPLEYMFKIPPDAYIGTIGEKFTNRYFLEIIDDHVPRFALQYRIKQYFEYYEENSWQTATEHPFPKILLICPDHKKLLFLTKVIQNLREETEVPLEFFVTEQSVIQTSDDMSAIWQQVV